MQIVGVIEIAPMPTGELPRTLMAAAYRASRRAAIMLVLRSTTRREVDRILDPVVRGEGINMKGLIYTDAEDERTVLEAARRASVVVASTEDFQRSLTATGIPWCSAAVAQQRLMSLADAPVACPSNSGTVGRETYELAARI
jgi:hypothetical protein